MLNTLLPYPSFKLSVKCLDNQRLSNQRIQVIQILQACMHTVSTEPIVQMWRQYTPALAKYGIEACSEWIERGNKDGCLRKILFLEPKTALWIHYLPSWVGDDEFHTTHKSYLLRKYPDHYKKYFEGTPLNLQLKFFLMKGD